jgi:hypothetical protein
LRDLLVSPPLGGTAISRSAGTPPRIEARTRFEDPSFDRALEIGFGCLAGYPFGGNAGGESLAMTGPVLASGEQLAMTGPVQTRAGRARGTPLPRARRRRRPRHARRAGVRGLRSAVDAAVAAP